MDKLIAQWRDILFKALCQLDGSAGVLLQISSIVSEIPPKPEMGDLAFPMFPYAKILRMAPPIIAQKILAVLHSEGHTQAFVLGPYINVKLDREPLVREVVESVLAQGDRYGHSDSLTGRKILIEFSCPNTNKPLHLGHMRNNALGESLSRIFTANGAQVLKVNLINDRGIHICKSMLAYQKLGQGATPESAGLKSDHFVGEWYVRYNQLAAETPEIEKELSSMLLAWEAGDPEVRELWQTMNDWAVHGIQKTYDRTKISFDRYYYEHDTYILGKSEVAKGLAQGVFYKRDDGAIVFDLPWKTRPEDENLAQKVLLRADGTSIYLTQDVGTAVTRHGDWPFDEMYYVVASEQDLHFKVLFYCLEKLGYEWAKQLTHISYGLVNLPSGRMKTREGTVVDADDLMDLLSQGARKEILEKGRENDVEDLETTSEDIALGALHYFLLQQNPTRDMIFNPEESLAFAGNTGPYLQYMGARISSLLSKLESQEVEGVWTPSKLNQDQEWDLVKFLHQFPTVVATAARDKSPAVLASFAYDLAKSFSRFYHDLSVLGGDDNDLKVSRLQLSRAVLQVMQNCFSFLNIPFLRSM